MLLRKKNISALCIILSIHLTTYAGILIPGQPNLTNATFNSSINTCAYDQFDGTIYVGLDENTQDPTSNFSISRSTRYLGHNNHKFLGIAPTELSSQTISFLSLSHTPENSGDILGTASNAPQTIFIMNNDGTNYTATSALNDANSTPGEITAVTANTSYAVAALAPASTPPTFGNTNSGLALIEITRSGSKLTLTTKNADSGMNGNKSILLDNSSSAFTGGTNPVMIADNTKPSLLYDKQLNCFYVGTSMATPSSGNPRALSVALAKLSPPNQSLSIQSIISDPTIATGDNHIIAASGTDEELRVNHLAVFHASTGPSYLIVAGGNKSNNTVYALPLVDSPSSANSGQLANKNSSLDNGKFTEPATETAHLAISLDLFARIGVDPLPFPISTETAISDLSTIGDTVYVSVKTPASATSEPGIFYSQALFDADGKVISWTPWTKKVLSNEPFQESAPSINAESISFFDIDVVNGNVWFIHNDNDSSSVGSTTWIAPGNQPENSLAYTLQNRYLQSSGRSSADILRIPYKTE